jgi:hypothetical protein
MEAAVGREDGGILHRWFVQYNPLYFASALLVLGGLFLVAGGLGVDDIGSHTAVAAIAQLYQFLLLGAARLLVSRPCGRRPALLLGLVTLVFLFDGALCSERLASAGRAALPVAAALGVLDVAKLALLCRLFRLRGADGSFAVAASALFALPVLPHLVDAAGGRDVVRDALHLGLSSAGAAMFAWALLRRRGWWSELVTDDWSATVLRRLETVLPFVVTGMSVVHVMAWSAYLSVPLSPAHGAPWILVAGAALAVRLARAERPGLAELAAWAASGGALLAAAFPARGLVDIPLAIAAVGCAAVLFALAARHGLRLALPATVCAFLVAGAPGFAAFALLAIALLGATWWQRRLETLVASAAALAAAVLYAPGAPCVETAPLAALAFGGWLAPWSWLLFPSLRRWLPVAICGALELLGALYLGRAPGLELWIAGLAAIAIALAAWNRRPEWIAAGTAGCAVLAGHFHAAWVPRSLAGWGLVLLVAGFAALVAGVGLNLRAARRQSVIDSRA